MNSSINETLKNIQTEDLIWIIYLFLAIASLISNEYEKETLLRTGNQRNNDSKKINVTIFTITFIIYIYFAYINLKDIQKIKNGIQNNSTRSIIESQARLIASLLFIVGGAIYLITEANSSTEEIAII